MWDRHHVLLKDRRPRYARVCGFTLLEALVSMAILALTCSSVLVVMDRCMKGTGEVARRLEAFAVARENMEVLLTATKVSEYSDFGMSDKYPSMEWQNQVEVFTEPVMGDMWVRAVCTASFQDDDGQTMKVELVHWLTRLTDAQQKALQQTTGEDSPLPAEDQVLETMEDAAAYAGVDVDTIEQWLNNGMLQAPDGTFIKHNLDIFMQANGNPSDAQRSDQIVAAEDLGPSSPNEPGDNSSSESAEQKPAEPASEDAEGR